MDKIFLGIANRDEITIIYAFGRACFIYLSDWTVYIC